MAQDVVQYLLKVTDPDNTYLWNEIVITLILAARLRRDEKLPFPTTFLHGTVCETGLR